MENNKDSMKLNKSIFYTIIITAVIVFIVSYLIFSYIPNNKETSKLNEYKKALYDSIVCQYSCPLSLQEINNKTQEAPNAECVQSCTQELRDSQASGDIFSNAQLSNDNLIKDIEDVISVCKDASIRTNSKTNLPELNSTIFFPCSSEALKEIKKDYSYLN